MEQTNNILFYSDLVAMGYHSIDNWPEKKIKELGFNYTRKIIYVCSEFLIREDNKLNLYHIPYYYGEYLFSDKELLYSEEYNETMNEIFYLISNQYVQDIKQENENQNNKQVHLFYENLSKQNKEKLYDFLRDLTKEFLEEYLGNSKVFDLDELTKSSLFNFCSKICELKQYHQNFTLDQLENIGDDDDGDFIRELEYPFFFQYYPVFETFFKWTEKMAKGDYPNGDCSGYSVTADITRKYNMKLYKLSFEFDDKQKICN
jgi:hypothetical protein